MNNLSACTDYELVEMYENGKDSAFDEILKRHQGYVFSYIQFLVKNEERANDIFQETFARAILAIRAHKYQSSGKFSAWLIRIAHNLTVDSTRDMETSRLVMQDEFSPNILNSIRLSEEACEGSIIEKQDATILRKMLDYLPEVQREVVILRFYEDLSFKEIAEKTGVSINTSLGRMRYALINLRKMVQKHQMSLVG